MTCLVKLDPINDSRPTSVCIKVFSNKQAIVTMTDNDKFGSTYSIKKEPLQVQEDAMFGGGAAQFNDAFDEFALSGEEPLEKESVAATLLLGDRSSQEIGKIFACNLFQEMEKLDQFRGIESVVLQISSTFLQSKNRREQMLHAKALIASLIQAFTPATAA